jgi:hypothetical protein
MTHRSICLPPYGPGDSSLAVFVGALEDGAEIVGFEAEAHTVGRYRALIYRGSGIPTVQRREWYDVHKKGSDTAAEHAAMAGR